MKLEHFDRDVQTWILEQIQHAEVNQLRSVLACLRSAASADTSHEPFVKDAIARVLGTVPLYVRTEATKDVQGLLTYTRQHWCGDCGDAPCDPGEVYCATCLQKYDDGAVQPPWTSLKSSC